MEITGEITDRRAAKIYPGGVKYFMKLDVNGQEQLCMVELAEERQVQNNPKLNERSIADIGDIVRITCRRDKSGWCSVTLNQSFEIIKKFTRQKVEKRKSGTVSKRYSPKYYEDRQVNRYFMEFVSPGKKVYRAMVLTNQTSKEGIRTNFKYSDDRDQVGAGDVVTIIYHSYPESKDEEWINVDENDSIIIGGSAECERLAQEEKERQAREEAKRQREELKQKQKEFTEKGITEWWDAVHIEKKRKTTAYSAAMCGWLLDKMNVRYQDTGNLKIFNRDQIFNLFRGFPGAQINGVISRLIENDLIELSSNTAGRQGYRLTVNGTKAIDLLNKTVDKRIAASVVNSVSRYGQLPWR